ncbi:MAG: outer membrane protein assembly factor BamA [Nitrospirota bacterium]|nr:outer membrane protein assembly factor BamA [Nitrospirota bacterium]
MIDEILFDADGPYDAEALYTLIGFKPGDRYQAGFSRKAIERLHETGRFKSLRISLSQRGKNALVLRFHWLKKRLMASISFSKNRFLNDKALREVITLQTGTWFGTQAFEETLSNIRTLYRKAGYFQTKLTSSLKPSINNPQAVDILITVTEGLRARIRKLRFLGQNIFSDFHLGLKIYSKAKEFYLFDELQLDLLRLKQFYEKKGYFRVLIGPTAVNYNNKTNEVDIDITIQPHEQLALFFEGDNLYSKKDLEALLLIQKERSLDLGVLESSAEKISRFYLGKGYPAAKTQFRLKGHAEENRVEVTFTIDSGLQAVVKKIDFSGHYAFLKKVLLAQIALSPSRRLNKVHFTKDALEKDVTALTLFYREEGFQNVTVTSDLQWNHEKTEASLLFKIDEGIRSRIHTITLNGNLSLDDYILNKALLFALKTPFKPAKVREGRRALISAYAREGYLRAEISPELHFSLDQRDAHLTYHVTEGPQTFFGEIALEGNVFTKDEVILRELNMDTDAPYNPSAVLESQQHLYKTGYFSSVRIQAIQEKTEGDIKENRQDLEVSVVEKPRVALDFGIGYADREETRGVIEITHQNLWGTGQSLSARLQRSRVEERYFLTYRKPWFFDKSITGRITASFVDLQEVAFDLKTFSIVTGIEKVFSNRLTGALLYQIERKQTSNVAPKAIKTDEDQERFIIGSINPSLIYDTRKNPFNPRSGSVTSLVIRDAAKILGSEVQLLKLTLQRRSYHALSKKWVFAFSGRIGLAERFGETENIPIAERFFIGGRNTVRGYDEDELGISGITFENNAPTGGNGMLILNEELRYALPKSFGLVFFFDHGNVWRRYQDFEVSEIKSTAGLGLRYNTPIGPFRLDWGYKLNREGDESPSAFHFTLGHAF